MDDVRVLEALEQLAPGTASALTDDLLAQRRHMRAVECLATRQQDLLSSQLAGYRRLRLLLATWLGSLTVIGGTLVALSGDSVYGFAAVIFQADGLLIALLMDRRRRRADA